MQPRLSGKPLSAALSSSCCRPPQLVSTSILEEHINLHWSCSCTSVHVQTHMYQGILTRKPFTMLNRLLNPNLLSLCSKMSRWMRNYKKRCNSHVVCLCKDVLQLCFTSAEQKPSWLSLFAPSFCVQQVILYTSYM